MQGAEILLVEDDDVLRSVVERNLVARGHDVSIAVDVQSAIEKLRAKKFDLILLDINLPDRTGWDVLRAAQVEGHFYASEQEMAGKLPVCVLSAVRVSPSRLAEFHPLAYLPKPFPMDAVLRLAAESARRRHEGTVNATEQSAQHVMPVADEEDSHA